MDCRMPLAKEEKHQDKPITCFCVFSLAVRSCILYCALRFSFHFFHQLHFPLFGPVYPSFFLRVYLKSWKYGLFLQTQRDFALRQYRIILSAAAAGAVLKPSGGNCAVLPWIKVHQSQGQIENCFGFDEPLCLFQIYLGKSCPRLDIGRLTLFMG